MSSSAVSSDPRLLSGAALLVLLALLPAGCASRRAAPPDLTRPQGSPPPVETGEVSAAVPGAEAPALPGAGRVYPSREEKNQAPADAPEAFALDAGAPPTPAPLQAVSGRRRRTASLPDEPSDRSSRREVFSVQLFASASRALAERRGSQLEARFSAPVRVEKEEGLFKVRLGLFATRAEAERSRRRALDLGLRDAFVVKRNRGGGS
jgi:hypothetical protein